MIRRGAQLAFLACLLLGLGGMLRAADEDPDTDSSPYHQALLNYKAGHYDAARVAIDSAIQQNPANAAAVLLKARILTELHQFDDARKTLESLNDNPHLTPVEGDARTLTWADLCLRKGDFDGATKFYETLLAKRPGDSDLILRIVYARIGASDLVDAAKYASQLKPLDPVNPAYYFAKAALAQTTGRSSEADEDIETVRTIYGITVANRYLKTYFEIFATIPKTSAASRAEPPSTNAAPAQTPAKP